MDNNIILKRKPQIEFQLHENGFELIDRQTAENSGFYVYSDLQSVDLNSVWFPRLSNWLRAISWILNGVPYFPDSKSYKKANIIINLKNSRLGIWLTDAYMADKAKVIKKLLDEKTNPSPMLA